MTSIELVPAKLALKFLGPPKEIPNPYLEWNKQKRKVEEKHNKSKEGQVELAENALKEAEEKLKKATDDWNNLILKYKNKLIKYEELEPVRIIRNVKRYEYDEALEKLIKASEILEISNKGRFSKIFSSSKNKEAVENVKNRVIANSEARLGIIRTSATSSRSSAAGRGRDVGGANKMKVKKPLKKLVNKPVVKAVNKPVVKAVNKPVVKPVKKPLKKLVKKPVVKPAKKKVATTRARK